MKYKNFPAARGARLAYRDFRFEGRAVFAEIGPPHTHVILFERGVLNCGQR
jgi:hypothetical protein